MTSVMSEGLKKTLGLVDGLGRTPTEIDTLSPSAPARSMEITEFVPKKVESSVSTLEKTDLGDDYITSRNITHALIDYAGSALQGALQVSIESQHPKAFEMFDRLANTMRGLSKDLIDMQKVYQSIVDANNGKVAAANITQNNVTINTDGASTTNTSMSEVVKMIKKMADKGIGIPKNVIADDDADFIEMED